MLVNMTKKACHLKNNAPFRPCVSKINKTFIDNSEDLDIVILMTRFILLLYSDNFSMTSELLWNEMMR